MWSKEIIPMNLLVVVVVVMMSLQRRGGGSLHSERPHSNYISRKCINVDAVARNRETETERVKDTFDVDTARRHIRRFCCTVGGGWVVCGWALLVLLCDVVVFGGDIGIVAAARVA